ncbi:MAG: prolipoprotein diacylglyceryl transferase [Candidatus Cloacimonadota bacterium]|nr:MAG: prolipoprotein diacylglyceryl transferase [Candidatus Cloacimonadota bacterium]
MINYPQINPTIVKLGFLEIRWYGLFYIISFVLGYIFLKRFYAFKKIKIDKEQYDNLLFYIMLGVIVGGRLGYVLFYKPLFYLTHPLHIFAVWEGGMSFHGGALGVIIFGLIFCKKYNFNFYQLADPTMPLVAIGLGLGRLGNFINAELYGRVTNVPWAMIFPTDPEGLPRHPSQLYESFLEGFVLFLLSYFILRKSKREGTVFWAFIGLYGIFRFFLEFFREPDSFLGYLIGFLTMGQILSSFMIFASIIALVVLHTKKNEN